MESKSLNIVKRGTLEYIQFPKLCECGCVEHIFSTRLGGVSTGCEGSMNLSFSKDRDPENVRRNFEILCGAVNIDTKDLVLSHQTHTNNVITVDEKDKGRGFSGPSFSDVDGMVTNTVRTALVTQFADCTPLLFCDPVKRVIANSHAGWKGTASLIGKVTVDKMVNEFGCDPKDIIAGIGPCIGQCCYEVDDPVYEAFIKTGVLGLEDVFLKKENGRYMLDLAEANRIILLCSGILPEHIDKTDICTCCNSDELHSHRATGGKRGNLAAVIQLKESN